ncbi:receptor-like protein 7 [Abrus precatorius]|uniref:Receptor-like protein 7 n=1 Tax=Abrus precatorius TaxID=3816 RepID=A0A8B8K2J6_ABRPR|nr:receptor-like protein 7 [Abrus precatorius]
MTINQMLWLSLLPFFFINLSINTNIVIGQCLGHQQAMLLQFKNNLIFNPTKSKKLIYWNQSNDCCRWTGVACFEGHVVALDLSQESISGGIENSSNIFNLHYLQSLNLAYNEIHSMIPLGFHKLKNLRYLNLSNAGFMGQIPIEISYLTKLVTLDLSSTLTPPHTLKLENPNIAMFVQNFTEIKELYMDGIAISVKRKEWSQALSSLQNLQVLSMSSCNLSISLDSSLAKLQSLSTLRLNHNNISSPVPEYLGNMSNLTTLQLTDCGLGGVFPRVIFQIPALQVLDVSNNLGLHGSLPNLTFQGSLHYLNLSHTKFSGSLPQSIHKFRQLSILDLSNCQFSGTLPNSLSDFSQLVHLDLSFNNFTGPLPSFNRSKALRVLSLNNNDFNGTIQSTHFEGLVNLVSIDLGDNFLNGRIPSSLFTLPSLQVLMLSYNKFDEVLEEFSNASSSLLEMLDLSGNYLQGPIPFSIFHLKRLGLLQLSSNKFNGTIQLDMIQHLPKLTTLDLGLNNLSIDVTNEDGHDVSSFPNLNNVMLASCKLRTIPNFLRNQSSLLFLDLSSNQIEGTIPNWIWRFDSMIYLNLSNNFLTDLEGPFNNLSSNLFLLDLHSNLLQGPTPFFPKTAIYLDYSNNGFNSITPPDIGNHLPFTYSLSLSNNNFSGKIHESFCNALALRVLDLSYNNFNDTIPNCLITMSNNLRVLNIGGNKLENHIPDTFSTSCALRFLDLNGNLLDGTIPKSLTSCQKLQVLNLGNNLLSDRFPCFLKNISTLSVMILRSNELYGHIGCPNNIGNWEMLQIVDLASNNFYGVLPSTLLQSWRALMHNEDEAGPRFAHLFVDIYDNVDPINFEAALSIVNNDLKMWLAKLIAAEPLFMINHLISDDAKESGPPSFQDSVTIVYKGQQWKLDKILTAFTCLDLSSNHFEGSIPEELMNLKALHSLNLSKNAFSGHIPSYISNLIHLESLDLSNNSLSSKIPTELASLSFLSYMNLSYNHLVGKIPTGTQIQSFEANSFLGNEGLCGPPLTQNCTNERGQGLSPPISETSHSHAGTSINWNFLSAELGCMFGLGLFFLPLIVWKKWRLWYCKHVDDMLYKFISQLDFVYEHRGGKKYRTLRWKPY